MKQEVSMHPHAPMTPTAADARSRVATRMPSPGQIWPGLRWPGLGLLWRGVGQAVALRRQRRALLALDDHLLNDIGLTRAQALDEAERPALPLLWPQVWDAPRHWRN
jgi:uncharacterized protein YjiS (DUF1127 family)